MSNKYKDFILLVEGDDDQIFFQKIIQPSLQAKYRRVRIIKYANLPKPTIEALIHGAQMNQDKYVFCADRNSSPCIPARKKELIAKYPTLSTDSIVIIVKEIESWYLAGLSKRDSKTLGLTFFPDTQIVGKGRFKDLIPKDYKKMEREFKLLLLSKFKIFKKVRNNSLAYFLEKYKV